MALAPRLPYNEREEWFPCRLCARTRRAAPVAVVSADAPAARGSGPLRGRKPRERDPLLVARDMARVLLRPSARSRVARTHPARRRGGGARHRPGLRGFRRSPHWLVERPHAEPLGKAHPVPPL